MRCHPLVLLCILAVIGSSSAQAGTFQHSDLPLFDPYIVVHPAGYDGTGGNLQIHICSAPETRFAVLSAISHWNALERTIGNCTGCRLWEEGSSGSDAPFSMESVMLHEFGHCAMGIDHINWIVGAQQTSYTHGVDVSFYTDGVDGIRGSSDDGVSPPTSARLTHWFRLSDNDPFVIDTTTIDGCSS